MAPMQQSLGKTICFQKDGVTHSWVHAKHWTDEYLNEMLEHLKKYWPDVKYYIGYVPLTKCCAMHGAK